MSRIRTPDSISNTGVTLGFLVSVKQKQMLKELAEREDSSMNRYVRRLIEREYKKFLSEKYKNNKSGGEYV
jgi:Fe-S cluster biosynthesis and repair protein YggX